MVAILQSSSPRRWVANLWPMCVALIVSAAAYDLAENRAILNVTEQSDATFWPEIRPASLIKWTCVFAVILLETPFYLSIGAPGLPRILGRVIGFVSIPTAILGLYSSVTGYEVGIERATLPLLVSMLVMPVFLFLGGRASQSDRSLWSRL